MADEFPFSLSRVVAAHVCESFGFQGVQRSALDTLADVLVKFLTTAGEFAHQYAENAGRTEAHAGDVMAALQDIAPTSPADLTRFVRFVEDSASPTLEQSIPRFPLPTRPKFATPSFHERQELPPPRAEIPEWLPAFPDDHTYVNTPTWEGLGSGGSEKRKERARALENEEGRERRRAERSLIGLHQRMGAVAADGGAEMSGALWGSWQAGGAGQHGDGIVSHQVNASGLQGGHTSLQRQQQAGGSGTALVDECDGDTSRKGGQEGRRDGMAASSGDVAAEIPTVGDVFGGLLASAGGKGKGEDGVTEEEHDSETEEELRAIKGARKRRKAEESGSEDRKDRASGWSGWSTAQPVPVPAGSLPRESPVVFNLGQQVSRRFEEARMSLIDPPPGAADVAAGRREGEDGGGRRGEEERKGKERKERGKEDETEEKKRRVTLILRQGGMASSEG